VAHEKSVTLLTICGNRVLSCGDDQKLRSWEVTVEGERGDQRPGHGGDRDTGNDIKKRIMLSCVSTFALQNAGSAVASGSFIGGDGGCIAVTGNFEGEVFLFET